MAIAHIARRRRRTKLFQKDECQRITPHYGVKVLLGKGF